MDYLRMNVIKKLSQLVLTSGAFEDNNSHIEKLLLMLRILLLNGPSSKWDLATVGYVKTRTGSEMKQTIESKKSSKIHTKKGLTGFSWVLTHKMILELVKINLVQKYGKSDKSTKNKKHVVDLYYPTEHGITFLILADNYIHSQNNDGVFYKKLKTETKHLEDLIELLNSVWYLAKLDPKLGKGLRIYMMKHIILKNTSCDIVSILLLAILEFLEQHIQENIFKVAPPETDDSKTIIGVISLVTSLLGLIKSREAREFIALSLIQKASLLKFNANVLRELFKQMKINSPQIIKAEQQIRVATERIELDILKNTHLFDITKTLNSHIDKI